MKSDSSSIPLRSQTVPQFEVNYLEVDTFADLPLPSICPDKIYLVKQSTGIPLYNKKHAGLYHSSGLAWTHLGGVISSLETAMPVGTVIDLHPSAPAPNSDIWCLCDGRTYPNASILGANAPDLTGRFRRFGLSEVSGGADSVALAAANIPSHRHIINHDHPAVNSGYQNASHTHYFDREYNSTNGGYVVWQKGASGGPNYRQTTSVQSASHKHSVNLPNFVGNSGYYGSGAAFSIVPKYYSVKMYIRYR